MDLIVNMWLYIVLVCLPFLLVFTFGCVNNQNNNQQNQIQNTKQKIVYNSLHKGNQILLNKTRYARNIVEEYDTDIYTKDMLQYVFDDMESMGYKVDSIRYNNNNSALYYVSKSMYFYSNVNNGITVVYRKK